ncbi:hypothetical protein A3765_03645 [Oleiphilus sp. HI0130]|nr:hypothetical protein A3758_11540 [Oleiphilus sp. HI0118]KZZ69382.1 hypothetical protein A3765_03645 [Oleiphilus sp. HI0130]
MFPFLKSKGPPGVVGLEVRPDGLGIAISRGSGDLMYAFEACNAAERVAKLRSIVDEQGLEKMACRVVLPFDQYKTYSIDKPQVEDSEVPDAARWRVKDMLDFDLDDAITDVYEFPVDALRGRTAQVNVVICRRTIIQGLVNLVNDSGMALESIDIAELCLRNVAVTQVSDPERPVAMLYLRRGAGIMVFVKDHSLYLARHFDFSTEALNEPSQQEQVIQQLALEVQRSFDYFESQLGQRPPGELILFGPDPSTPLANMLGGSITAKVIGLDLNPLNMENDLEAINALVSVGAMYRGERD